MNDIYIFGHMNPDTDSVCAAISLAYLKNKIGQKAVPYVLNTINKETKFVLDYFNEPEPKYLNDVKLQIKNVNYNKGFMLDYHASIYDAYLKMVDSGVSAIPITKNKKLIGIVTLKDMARDLIDCDITDIDTSYDNIINSLEGEEILRFDDEINGKLIAATYKSTTIIETIPFNKNDVLIVGDRHSVIEYAIKSNVKLIILVGSSNIKDEHIELAKQNKVNIIRTKLYSLATTKRINLCNYVKTIFTGNESFSIEENTYIDDFIGIANKLKHTHYPVVDKSNNCLGMLRMPDINDVNKKKVILVDHNEFSQSCVGIEESDILEIFDHHKIGNINSKAPINFRNMAVGSTCTIIYILYTEYGIEIPNNIRGLLLSGILSDTLLFKSPTSTELDYFIATKIAKELNVDYTEYAMKMFKASSDYKNVSDKSDVLYEDFKVFNIKNIKIGVGQITTLNIDDIKNESKEYIELLNKEAKQNNYLVFILMVTDIIENGSYIFYNESAKEIIENSFSVDDFYQGYFLKDCLSRKKQIIPNIMEVLDR